jgi:biotin carboxylase
MASDLALPTVARVARELNLPGPGENLVRTLTNKISFRRFQTGLGLDCPASIETPDFDDARARWPGGPVVTKPAVSSGSRGVHRLDTLDANAGIRFEQACRASFNGQACLEEFIPGQDVTVEGFICKGKIRHAFITRKHVSEFAVLGHEMPSGLSQTQRDEMLRQIQTIADEVGYRAGPFDADFRINADRVVLLEIAPRLGGNGMPLLAQLTHGAKLIEWALQLAAGDEPDSIALEPNRKAVPGAAVLLHSGISGTVTSVATADELRDRLAGVVDVCLNLKQGETVKRFEHGGHVFGYCVLEQTREENFNGVSNRVFDALGLEVAQTA